MKQLGVVRDHEAVDASPPELGAAAVRYLYSETLSMGAPNFLFIGISGRCPGSENGLRC